MEEEKTVITALPSGTAVTRKRLEFAYDAQGRRIGKRVLSATGSGSFVLQQRLLHLYDGWNMIAEIDTTSSAQLLRSYEWGMDLSGTLTGAGGVGGLLIERFHAASSPGSHLPPPGAHAPLYDGNGNVTELVNLATGSVSARYEYGAFGETISMDGGAVAEANPFRFSTKYLDVETGFYNYGYRYYDSVNGRWLNRDPIGINGGINLYGMVGNDPVNRIDYLGLLKLVIEHRRTVYGVFATYGELTVSVDDANVAACCKFPMSFKSLEPPRKRKEHGILNKSQTNGYTRDENTPIEQGPSGRTSPQRFFDNKPPPAPDGTNPNDWMAGMNFELVITGLNNMHAGVNGMSTDGCIIIGSEFVQTSLSGDPFRQPGTQAGLNYQVPGFTLEDSRLRYASLMQAIACVKRNNKGNHLSVKYTRTDTGATVQNFTPVPRSETQYNKVDQWNPNVDGVGVPVAIPVSNPGGGFLQRFFNDISNVFR